MGIFSSPPQNRFYVPPVGRNGRSTHGTLLGGPPRPPSTWYDEDPNVVRVSGGDGTVAPVNEIPGSRPADRTRSAELLDGMIQPKQDDGAVVGATDLLGRGIAVSPEPAPGTHADKESGQIVVLPNGTRIPDDWPESRSPTGYVMSPRLNLEEVAVAGRRAGENHRLSMQRPEHAAMGNLVFLRSLFAHAGTGGKYDYQREGHQIFGHVTGFKQLRQFQPIANINVGLFCQQAGLSLEDTLKIAGFYASILSSNAKPDKPYGLDPRTAHFIKEGYKIGQSGMFDRPGLP